MIKRIFAICSVIMIVILSSVNCFALPIYDYEDSNSLIFPSVSIDLQNAEYGNHFIFNTPSLVPNVETDIFTTLTNGHAEPDYSYNITQNITQSNNPYFRYFYYATDFDVHGDTDDVLRKSMYFRFTPLTNDGTPTISFLKNSIFVERAIIDVTSADSYGNVTTKTITVLVDDFTDDGVYLSIKPFEFYELTLITDLTVEIIYDCTANQLNIYNDSQYPIRLSMSYLHNDLYSNYVTTVKDNIILQDGTTFLSWMGNAMTSFFNAEIFPSVSLGSILIVVLAFVIVKAVLHYVAGG